MTDSIVCEPEGLTTLYEQNPNVEQYRLNDSDWSILVDMNAYLDILRRFNIEVDVESCESGSRLFGALRSLEGQLRLFRRRKPHMEPISDQLRVIEDFIRYWLLELPWIHIMGNRFIAMQTLSETNIANSPQPDDKADICVRALYGP